MGMEELEETRKPQSFEPDLASIYIYLVIDSDIGKGAQIGVGRKIMSSSANTSFRY